MLSFVNLRCVSHFFIVLLGKRSLCDMRYVRLLGLVAAVAVTLFCFAPSFAGYEYVFDDNLAIEFNADANSTRSSWWDLFFHDFWGKSVRDRAANRSYRPFTTGTYRLQHLLDGDFFMWRLRFVNVALHGINSLLVGAVGWQTGVLSTWPGVWTAVMTFVVHPVHVESVVNMVGRAELLNAFFGLLSFLAWHRCLQSTTSIRRALFGALWVLLCVCGCLSKDSFVALIGVQLLYLLVLRQLGRDPAAEAAKTKPFFGIQWQWITPCLSLIVGYFVLRALLMEGVLDLRNSGLLRKEENPHLFIVDKWEKAIFIWYLQCKNMQLLWVPWPLCSEYSYNCLPTITSWDDARIPPMLIGSLAFLVFCGVVAYRSLWMLFKVDMRFGSMPARLAMCVAWTVVPYLPVSHLFMIVGTMLAERCLYVPSIGICFGVAIVVETTLKRRWASGAAVMTVVLVIVSAGAQLSSNRSEDWTTNKKLFESAVRVCPNSAKNNQQIALIRYNEGRYKEGVVYLKNALKIDPNFCEANWHIARYLINQTRIEEAEGYLRHCCTCDSVAENCYNAYRIARKSLHPNLTLAEESKDSADAFSLGDKGGGPIPASLYRQAGLAFLQQDKRPCEAHRVFLASVRQREKAEHHNFVQGNREDSLCNVYYWAVKSGSICRSAARNAQRRQALMDTILSLSSNATVHCRVDWDFVSELGKTKGPKELMEDAEIQEMLDRPLSVKNIAMEAMMLLEETKRSPQSSLTDSSTAGDHMVRIALAPVCEVSRTRVRGQENKASGRVMKKLLEADTSAESTFLPIALQQVVRRMNLVASTPSTEWDAAIDHLVLFAGANSTACSPEVEAAVRCEAAFGLAERSRGPVRARYRSLCADGRVCQMTSNRCSALRG